MSMQQAIFDWKRTLYDPEAKTLISEAKELLEYLSSKKIPMILIGKGGDDMQQELVRLGVEKYFAAALFAEGKKDSKVFKPYMTANPANTFFFGDRVRSELEIGNSLGGTTVWIRQGKFSIEEPESKLQVPMYTVASLSECLALVKTFVTINA